MTGNYRTPQEATWAGEFGDAYMARNRSFSLFSGKLNLFAQVLRRAQGIESALELGANIGLNLRALRTLLPAVGLAGVEINKQAYAELAAIDGLEAHHGSLLDIALEAQFDLVFTAGVLIHIAPEKLACAYEQMARFSRRYIALIEYYSPTPVELPYRGHSSLLFKRDFAGEFLDRHPSFRVVDYGFIWRRDPMFPLDDPTWFLLEKIA
jgi:pseudaminic acid biosynthesis-associated methylase